ncbi:uncharacterized protein ACWYII_007630 isoform 3-T3 [Salvelinus alpinus]
MEIVKGKQGFNDCRCLISVLELKLICIMMQDFPNESDVTVNSTSSMYHNFHYELHLSLPRLHLTAAGTQLFAVLQSCWGGEKTKNIACANLRTGNAYRYCVDVKEESTRILCVEWMSMIPKGVTSTTDDTSTWLAELCRHKNTSQAPNVIDVSYSCITLLQCVNVDHTAISNFTEHWTHIIVSGASDEPKKPLEKEPDSQNTTADDVKQDVDNENPNHDNTHTWLIPDGDHPDTNRGDTDLIWKIIVGVVAVAVIAGLLFFCVYESWRDKQCNQGHRDMEEVQGNPEPNSIPLMQNERRDARDIRKPDDGKTVEAVVVPSDQGGEPGEESRQPMDNEETGADNPLLNGDASGQGEEGVLGMEDGKPSDNDRADTETCQKTHADSPPLNVPKVVRVNDETKEVNPGAQSPGPPQMNEGPPMSNRAAEETTALLDKQAMDKDQVTKPPELIDKGPNDMEENCSKRWTFV